MSLVVKARRRSNLGNRSRRLAQFAAGKGYALLREIFNHANPVILPKNLGEIDRMHAYYPRDLRGGESFPKIPIKDLTRLREPVRKPDACCHRPIVSRG